VNSAFTRSIYLTTFHPDFTPSSLESQQSDINSEEKKNDDEDVVIPSILYPPVDFSSLLSFEEKSDLSTIIQQLPQDFPPTLLPSSPTKILLSINRYERKKDVMLALKAFRLYLEEEKKEKEEEEEDVCLVIAGGYDERVEENIQVLKV